MSLLMNILVYLGVGCAEWYLALRRTLACARGEKALLVSIVFVENLLGLWVLANFVRTNNWSLALSYSGGASAGALLVATRTPTDRKKGHTGRPGFAPYTKARFQRYHHIYRQPVHTHGTRSRHVPAARRQREQAPVCKTHVD